MIEEALSRREVCNLSVKAQTNLEFQRQNVKSPNMTNFMDLLNYNGFHFI